MEGQKARVGGTEGRKAWHKPSSESWEGLGRPQPRRLWLTTCELTGSTLGSTQSQAEEARETAL